jgi:CRISPR/Cas system CSM-associated protein Csm4 (group 5 of RAMP superfamily)
MAKNLPPYTNIDLPESPTPPQNDTKSETGTEDKDRSEKLTKTTSFTVPIYLKDWLQNHADQMSANKSIEGRWTASKLVTQMIKEYKERMEVRT